jgi:hypothetical protein
MMSIGSFGVVLGLLYFAIDVVVSFTVVHPNPPSRILQTKNSLYATPASEFALLFDCDGVILETEELHRVAYNAAFQQFDLKIDNEPVVWSVRSRKKKIEILILHSF